MKIHIHRAAAMVVAAAIPFALAQTSPTEGQPQAPSGTTLSDANVPTTTPDMSALGAKASGRISHAVPEMNLVSEPVASTSRTEGQNAELGAAIAQAMNADPALQGSKITVQPDDTGMVTLTGSALTRAQVKRAGDIATAQVGEGNVVNTILPSEI